jgi:hypothetical protein
MGDEIVGSRRPNRMRWPPPLMVAASATGARIEGTQPIHRRQHGGPTLGERVILRVSVAQDGEEFALDELGVIGATVPEKREFAEAYVAPIS